MMSRCIVGNQYMPSVEFFAHWLHHGCIEIEAHEHFQKRTWRNRTAIVSSGHPLLLSVPLKKGKHQQQPIQKVEIAYHEPWAKLHVSGIQSAYGNTAYGEEVIPGLEPIFTSSPTTLWELNLSLLEYFVSLLQGQWDYHFTGHYVDLYPDEVVDLRKGIPAGIGFGAESGWPDYAQVQRINKSFQANLSILDMLCHLGPGTSEYISRYSAKLYSLS